MSGTIYNNRRYNPDTRAEVARYGDWTKQAIGAAIRAERDVIMAEEGPARAAYFYACADSLLGEEPVPVPQQFNPHRRLTLAGLGDGNSPEPGEAGWLQECALLRERVATVVEAARMAEEDAAALPGVLQRIAGNRPVLRLLTQLMEQEQEQAAA